MAQQMSMKLRHWAQNPFHDGKTLITHRSFLLSQRVQPHLFFIFPIVPFLVILPLLRLIPRLLLCNHYFPFVIPDFRIAVITSPMVACLQIIHAFAVVMRYSVGGQALLVVNYRIMGTLRVELTWQQPQVMYFSI